MKQTSNAKNWLRGGQIVDHNIRMFKQTAKRVFLATLIIAIGYIFIYTAFNTSANDRKLTLNYYFSSFMNYAGIGHGTNTIFFNRKNMAFKHSSVANSKAFKGAADSVNDILLISFFHSLLLNVVIYMLISGYIRRRGKIEQADKFLRGGKLVKDSEFKKALSKKQVNQNLSLGVVLNLKNTETIHAEISGTPGTGKSQTLKHLINDIKARGDKAVIYSSSTEFVSEFYDPKKDVILNPLDDRSPEWSLWNEVSEIYHYDDIAAALIPENEGGGVDPFWTKTARSLLSNTARKLKERGEYSTKILLDKLLGTSLKEIANLVKNTESATIFADGAERTALSVRATLLSNLASFKFLTNNNGDLSIRDWVNDETHQEGGCVFITSSAVQKEVLKPLISCWVDIFASSVLNLSENENRRIWLIIDELPSLHKLKSLQDMLAQSRKYGGCVVLGYQSYSQIEEIYGEKGAKTLSDLTATKVFFRSNNDYNAQHASNELGKEEIKSTNENIAMGAHTMRDSVSITENEKLRELVLPTQILNLNNLHGFYRLPGDCPVASFKQKIFKNSKEGVPGFMPSTKDNHIYTLEDQTLEENLIDETIDLNEIPDDIPAYVTEEIPDDTLLHTANLQDSKRPKQKNLNPKDADDSFKKSTMLKGV